jgi:hypothetical protein
MTINDKINLRGFVAKAAAMTEKQFKARIDKLGIGATGTFRNTLKAIGTLKGGSPLIEVSYIYYADFTAWGVGNGIAIGDNAAAKLTGAGRKRRDWKKQAAASKNLIADQLSYEYAEAMVGVVKSSLPTSILMRF